MGHERRIAEEKFPCRGLVGKKGKRSLERPRRRGEDNIEVDLNKDCWEHVDCIYMAQDMASDGIL